MKRQLSASEFVHALYNTDSSTDELVRSWFPLPAPAPEIDPAGSQIEYLVPPEGNGVNPRHPSRLYRGN